MKEKQKLKEEKAYLKANKENVESEVKRLSFVSKKGITLVALVVTNSSFTNFGWHNH